YCSCYRSTLGTAPLTYWIKVSRSGNNFTSYISPNGINWFISSNQPFTMGSNAYIGLIVSSNSSSNSATLSFDYVSVTQTSPAAPQINTLSRTTGQVGDQVLISGTGFGAYQGSSTAVLNGAATTINSWSDTAVLVTV